MQTYLCTMQKAALQRHFRDDDPSGMMMHFLVLLHICIPVTYKWLFPLKCYSDNNIEKHRVFMKQKTLNT